MLRAHRHRVAFGVDAVDGDAAVVALEQADQQAQQGGLAGAVRAEQRGDLAVARGEADAAQRLHGAELFAYIVYFNHGVPRGSGLRPGAAELEGRGRDLVQAVGVELARAGLSRKSRSRRGAQPSCEMPWPALATTRCWALRHVACAAASARRGGVTGSSAPDSISAGAVDLRRRAQRHGAARSSALHMRRHALDAAAPSARRGVVGRAAAASGAARLRRRPRPGAARMRDRAVGGEVAGDVAARDERLPAALRRRCGSGRAGGGCRAGEYRMLCTVPRKRALVIVSVSGCAVRGSAIVELDRAGCQRAPPARRIRRAGSGKALLQAAVARRTGANSASSAAWPSRPPAGMTWSGAATPSSISERTWAG